MAHNNRLKAAFIVGLILSAGAGFAAADMSYGEIIAKFVMSPFVSNGVFGDIKTAGQDITGAIQNTLPIGQIQGWLQKIRVASMILKILKATGAPNHIDLKQYFAAIRKIVASNQDFTGMTDEMRAAALNYTQFNTGNDFSYTGAGVTASSGYTAKLNLLSEENNSLLSSDTKLGLSDNSLGLDKNMPGSLNIGNAPNPVNINSKLDITGNGQNNRDEQGSGMLDIMEKFLNMILANADFISKIGGAVDKIDAVTSEGQVAQDQIAGFIDQKGNGALSKYGITSQDISTAQDVVEGKYSLENFDSVRQIISMLGKGNSTIDTFGKLIDLCKETGSMEDISEDTAAQLLIKVVNLIPSTASAIDNIKM